MLEYSKRHEFFMDFFKFILRQTKFKNNCRFLLSKGLILKRIADFDVVEELAETRKSKIYRVKDGKTGQIYVIKSLKGREPAVIDLLHFKKEYALVKDINLPGIIRILDLFESEGQWFLLLEDFPGISLKEFLKRNPLTIQEFLKIGIALAQTLGYLHQMDLIHKDIKPHNILVCPEDLSVKITDFGIATLLPLNDDTLKAMQEINGTLSYMAPEQTGRMNCVLDYRCDLYSLGISFYELLSVQLPFSFKEPMDLVYAHIALSPRPLSESRRDIPLVLQKIVLKLLEKNPESRYQNAFALAHDLGKCLDSYEANGNIPDFAIASKDISMRFNMPQLLVGREREAEVLLSGFWAACQGKANFVFVAGAPGVGKSSLVRSLQKDIIASHGLFVETRFEVLGNDAFGGGLHEAFSKMLRFLLTRSQGEISQWQEKISEHIMPFLPLLSEVLPEMKWFFSFQGDKINQDLTLDEKKRNLFQAFYQIMKHFAVKENPLVLFLDDLQWIDDLSLEFLQFLSGQPSLKYFLLIATLREEDQEKIIPLREKLKAVFSVESLNLLPLGLDGVTTILSRMFSKETDAVGDLADSVYRKTNGNPFFMQLFLKTLFNQGKIFLDTTSGWQWDGEGIENFKVTANVAELLETKMRELEPETLRVLSLASVIGFKFQPSLMVESGEMELSKIFEQTQILVRLGYFHREKDWYLFEHEHIRSAAYNRLPERERSRLHFKIGSFLREHHANQASLEELISMVEHLNRGADFYQKEKGDFTSLVSLNLQAAQRLILSNNFQLALHYAKEGLSKLSPSQKEERRELLFELLKIRMQCEFLGKKFEEGQASFSEALVYARTAVEKAQLYQIRFESYWHLTRLEEAIQAALEGLGLLGIHLRPTPSLWSVQWQLRKTRRLLGKKKLEDISNETRIENEEILIMLKFMTELTIAATYVNPPLAAMVNLKQVSLELTQGTSSYSSAMYAFYSSLLVSYAKDYQRSYDYGKLAIKLSERYKNPESSTKTYLTAATGIIHWKEPLSETIPLFKKAYEIGYQNGIYYYAGRALNNMTAYRIMLGHNLVEILEDYRYHRDFAQETGEAYIKRYYRDNLEMLCLLSGQTAGAADEEEDYSLEKRRLDISREGNLTEKFYVLFIELRLNYYFGRHQKSLALLDQLDLILPIVQVFHIPEYFFYQGLTCAAYYYQCSGKEQKALDRRLKKSIKKLREWALHAPENFAHKAVLLEAEWARLSNQIELAEQKYKEAIELSGNSGFLQNQAIACELAGKFYLGRGFVDIARIYLRESYQHFFRWGAFSKTKYMEDIYPHMLSHKFILSVKSRKWGGKEGTTSSATTFEAVDLRTVMKVSRAVLGTLELDELLKTILHIALENAGATEGVLLICDDDAPDTFLVVRGRENQFTLSPPAMLKDIPRIALAVIEYVRKTKETLVLDHARETALFQLDPHIQSRQVKSLLCIPISYKDKISGFLYLENNMSVQVFTRDRVEMLSVLASHAAISIENAQLIKQKEKAASLKKELEIASHIQSALLPVDPQLAGYELASHMLPAEEVGGDYYDIIADGEKDWVLIGDVAGHGLSSGLIMMMAQTAVRAIVNKEKDLTPTKLLRLLHQAVVDNMAKISYGKYLTLLALSVRKDGFVSYAGLHQDILVYRFASAQVDIYHSKGRWIGMDMEIYSKKVNFEDQELFLAAGDTLLLYTDGIVEARDSRGKMYGREALSEFLKSHGALSPAAIKKALLDEIKLHHVQDDLTFLVIKKQ